MKIFNLISTLILLSSLPILSQSEHLEPIPKATKVDKNVISLLQLGKIEAQSNGVIVIPIYNPTKYRITGCVLSVTFPESNNIRYYYSEGTDIKPLTDSYFTTKTQLDTDISKKAKIDIAYLYYTDDKKKNPIEPQNNKNQTKMQNKSQ